MRDFLFPGSRVYRAKNMIVKQKTLLLIVSSQGELTLVVNANHNGCFRYLEACPQREAGGCLFN